MQHRDRVRKVVFCTGKLYYDLLHVRTTSQPSTDRQLLHPHHAHRGRQVTAAPCHSRAVFVLAGSGPPCRGPAPLAPSC